MPIDEEAGRGRAAEGREVPHPAGKREEEATAAAVGSVDRLPPSQPMSLIGRPIFSPRSQGDVRYGLRRLDTEGQRRYSFDLRGDGVRVRWVEWPNLARPSKWRIRIALAKKSKYLQTDNLTDQRVGVTTIPGQNG